MARKHSDGADYTSQIAELVASAKDLRLGPTKVGVLEEAVRLADAHNDIDLGFEVRLDLINAATFGGAPEVSLVAFAWCLAQSDKEPGRFDTTRLLWMYKWVLDVVADYPQFGREQIEAMMADMERRYAEAGAGMHPVHQTARELHRLLGDLTEAAEAHERTMQCSEDPLSNCRACEQHAQVKFHLDSGRTDLALRTAEPLLAGRMRCAEVPHVTYSYLLVPLVLDGQVKQAADYHRKGLQLIGMNPKFLSQAARHIFFLAFTGNLPAAAKLFERHLPNAGATTCPAWRFDFARTAMFLFDLLAEAQEAPPAPPSAWAAAMSWFTGEKAKKKPLHIRFPASYALPDGVDRTDPAAVRDHFAAEARELARAFDARSGNDRFARQLDELPGLKERIVPFAV
ncbi:MAG TPA: hypothetical protein VGE74_26290 [Gemmata sp.]